MPIGAGAVLGGEERGLAAAVSDPVEVSVHAANVVALFIECGSDRLLGRLARSPEHSWRRERQSVLPWCPPSTQ
jgi:hypothetical protein